MPPGTHHKRQRCRPCSYRAARFNPPDLTEEQKALFKAKVGTVSRSELARLMGVSVTSAARYARHVGVSLANQTPKPVVMRSLLQSVRYRGLEQTRSRYGAAMDVDGLLQERAAGLLKTGWTDEQVVSLVRMGPFLPLSEQLKRLGRVGTGEAGISCTWTRVLKTSPSQLHGLSMTAARHLCRPGVPSVRLRLLRRPSRGTLRAGRTRLRLVLWWVAKDFLVDWLPDYLVDGVNAMALFQKWLYAPEEPDIAIRRLLTN